MRRAQCAVKVGSLKFKKSMCKKVWVNTHKYKSTNKITCVSLVFTFIRKCKIGWVSGNGRIQRANYWLPTVLKY